MTTRELAEWAFPQGGGLQVYRGPERAGNGSFTVSVTDIKAVIKNLSAIGIEANLLPSTNYAKTVMIKDPDGNSIAFAEKVGTAVAG